VVNLINRKKMREQNRTMQGKCNALMDCFRGMEMEGRRGEERIWEVERDSRSLNEFGVTEGVGGVVAVSRNLHEVPRQGWGRGEKGTKGVRRVRGSRV
jgi:hypothetical protein